MSWPGRCYYGAGSTSAGHWAMRQSIRGLRRLGLLRKFHICRDALELEHGAVVGLMRLWPRIHWSCGDGMMPSDELLTVYELAVSWPGAGATVELGSWVGLTTSYLATACRVRRRNGWATTEPLCNDGAALRRRGNVARRSRLATTRRGGVALRRRSAAAMLPCSPLGDRVFAVDTFEGTREGGGRYPSVAKHDGSTFDAFQAQIRRAGVEDLVTPLIGRTDEVVDHYAGGPIRFLLIDADHSYEGVRGDFSHWSPHVAPGGLIVFHDYRMPAVARFVDNEVGKDDRFAAVPRPAVPNLAVVMKKPTAEPPARALHLPACESAQAGANRLTVVETGAVDVSAPARPAEPDKAVAV